MPVLKGLQEVVAPAASPFRGDFRATLARGLPTSSVVQYYNVYHPTLLLVRCSQHDLTLAARCAGSG